MKPACRQFVAAVEEFFDTHPAARPLEPPPLLQEHVAGCPACRSRWQQACQSRRVLDPLRQTGRELEEADPAFLLRLHRRIQQQQARAAGWRGLFRLNIATRDLVLAAVLFLCTLGAFVYNFHRIERPNADEAMVLDVPHTNPQHPSDDHVQPGMADVMLNLMNP